LAKSSITSCLRTGQTWQPNNCSPSRQRERGLSVNLTSAFSVLHSSPLGAIAALGLLLLVIFVIWLAVAQAIYVATFGDAPMSSITEFLQRVFTTPEGWWLIVVGNGVGFLFALLVLSISVVPFPLLLDRDVGAVEAVLTSVRGVRENPVTMAIWGLIVALSLALGSLPLLVGPAVVMPVLGYAVSLPQGRGARLDPATRAAAASENAAALRGTIPRCPFCRRISQPQ
jgi:uncharacterized membrane protein